MLHAHTDIEIADQTFYLIQSQYTDTEPSNQPVPAVILYCHLTPGSLATGLPVFKSPAWILIVSNPISLSQVKFYSDLWVSF